MAKKTVITEVQDVEVGEAILEFPQNRTLMVEQLTHDDPSRPEVVKGLKTVEDVFEQFKPNVDVEFQDGGEIEFKNIKQPTRVYYWSPDGSVPPPPRSQPRPT